MRVLIADDTIVMRMMLSSWVETMGFTPVVAQDGAEALDIAFQGGFDIAVLDWEMPKLTGMEVIRELKEHPRTSYGHLILVTGRSDQNSLIQALDGGADDFIRKPLVPAEVVARLRAGARIVELRNRIMRLAETDPLTGAANRRCFLERAQTAVADAGRRQRSLSVLLLDIDHFKSVNDTRGHAGGDEALKRFVEACGTALRPTDLLGRFGGEEFAVLLPETNPYLAVAVADRVRAAIEATTIHHDGDSFRITASIGVSGIGADGLDAALSRADAALYEAKRAGRNRVEMAR
ncbi:GGDEF domain-containing response regulator [Azospirillum picis]|uniref:diguanylate cyclase n=1 Tax=Azospirillum picis TaxID=488438 RepID=A0ABU0MJ82_9PROT|nr:diguanylate cyclase [Azospirillum picis]MBP2299702.1 two-component system chemotaxis response regulator CheY [Azospirillum picis]MDQ0533498.1 two-component system chemotaxis response regulator CheY [Azospirillum picis]